MVRRPLIRTASASCPECRTRLTVDVPPRAYVRHVKGAEQGDVLWASDCPCGGRLEITVGQVARAA